MHSTNAAAGSVVVRFEDAVAAARLVAALRPREARLAG